MIKIGVLSDTHIQDAKEGIAFLEVLAERYFAEAKIILHAGDVVNPAVLQAFGERTVHVVRGNTDPSTDGIPARKIIEVDCFRIGLIHGWGSPDTIEERILREFRGENIDCLVFGHSHDPVCRTKEGILLFNPGSPTDRRRSRFHSVGMLELGTGIQGRIIPLDDI